MAMLSERVETLTGESPSWWVLELYKVAFLLVGGMYVGWQVGAQSATGPPEWLAAAMLPGVAYLLWVVSPGTGGGGMTM